MHFAASPQAGLPRRWWPLAVSLAVHALLIGLWLRHADTRPVAPEVPERLTVLVLAAPVAHPPPPAPQTKPDDKRTRRQVRNTPEPVAVVATPPAVPAAPAVIPEPAPAQATPSTADILAAARQDIGKLSRDPGGKLGSSSRGELRPGTGAWDRFGQRVADAHIDRAAAPSTDAYTSPDGQTYYRTRVGNKYYCRKTGSLDPSSTWKNGAEMHANSMSTLGMAGTSGLVLCPGSERDWKRQ